MIKILGSELQKLLELEKGFKIFFSLFFFLSLSFVFSQDSLKEKEEAPIKDNQVQEAEPFLTLQQEEAPQQERTQDLTSRGVFFYLLQSFFIIFILLGFLFFLRRYLSTKTINPGNTSSLHLAQIPLDLNTRIDFIKVMNEVYIIAVQRSSVRLLKVIPFSDELKDYLSFISNQETAISLSKNTSRFFNYWLDFYLKRKK